MDQQVATIIKFPVLDSPLEPAPIPPEDIITGRPEASMAITWRSADSTLYNGIWQCTPGVFTLTHPDETICFAEGTANLIPEGGEPIVVLPGEIVFVPEGTVVCWEVEETVRRAFHSHDSTGSLLG